MADNNVNNTANVSAGKGVKGGYFFSADATDENIAILKGETIKDFSRKITEIIASAVNLGFISEDGWKVSESRSVESTPDVNGDTINSSLKSREETITATLVELKKATLAEMYGQDNVTDENGLITALHTGDDAPLRIYIADLVLKNGRRWRYIVPSGQVTEVGDETIASGSVVGREITVTGNTVEWNGKSVTSLDILESTETERPNA